MNPDLYPSPHVFHVLVDGAFRFFSKVIYFLTWSYTYILMMYKEHNKSGRMMEWRREFAEAAKMCSGKVRGLPKGEKLRAYRMCMRETLKKR